jgi:competence protein ComEC
MSAQSGPQNTSLGPLTRRPTVSFVILFALGVLFHEQVPIRPWFNITIATFLAAFAAVFYNRKIICTFFLAVAIVLCGITFAQREHFQFASSDIAQFATDEPHMCELELYLPDEPQLLAGPVAQRELPPKQVAIAEVRRIKTWAGWISAAGRLPVQIDQPNPALDAGQTVHALGMLQRPRAAMNPGEFDFAAYYRQQRILTTFTVTRSNNCKIVSGSSMPAVTWLREKARHLLAIGFTQSHGIDHALLKALLLGDRDPQLRDVQEEFVQTGVAYQISVSGMHIAILAGAVFLLCRWMRLRPRWSLAITLSFVLLYAAVSLPSHSGVRSVILCIAAAAAMCSGRPVDRAQMLAIGALVMLLWHPLDLFSVGFHLSFAVVIVFVILLPKLRDWDRQHQDLDADVSRTRATPVRAVLHWTKSWGLRALQYSLLAWVATLPLVAFHFGQLSPWAIVGGIVLLPVVIACLFAGALKILLTLCWPLGAGAWATAAGWPVEGLQFCAHVLTKLPGGMLPLAAPPMWLIVVYYILLLATVLPEGLITGRWRWLLRLAPLLGIAAVLALPMLPRQAIAASNAGNLRITLLSLGAGQCAIVEPPGGHAFVFDAGSTTVPDLVNKIVEPFLRTEDQHSIDEVFLSHGDFDHISAAGQMAAMYDVHAVMTSYHFRRNAAGNIPDQMLLEELEKLNLPPHQIAMGDHFDLGSGAAVDCLWPPRTGELNSNNAGLVMRLTFAGRSVLFPADIQDPAFIGLLQHPAALKSDVLVAPHHGSSEDLTPAFLAAVAPQWIISSNASRLTNKQKRFNTMIGKIPLYRTSSCGAITVTITRQGAISIATFATSH